MRLANVLFVLAALLLLPAGRAAELESWDIDVSLEEDGTTKWSVLLQYKENTTRSDYFVLAKLTEVGVLADDKFVDYKLSQPALGTSIVAEGINASRVEYRFRALGLVTDLYGFGNFKYRFSVTEVADRFRLAVKLPLGFGLVEKQKLQNTGINQFEPEWGLEGSDGRRIYVSWELEKPKIGQTLDVSVLQERVLEINQVVQNLVIVVLATVILIFVVHLRRRSYAEVLPVLTEGERKVMEILLKEKKDVDQRRIVKELDYSKAKVSRIVQNLVQSGLIESIRKGRNNLLRLRKMKKPEEVKKDK